MSEEKVVISVENLSKLYPIKQNFFQSLTSKVTDFVHAVDGLSFKIHKGETLGLVGESGCGKSTTGYLTLNLLKKTDGTVRFMDIDINSISKNAMRKLREKSLDLVVANNITEEGAGFEGDTNIVTLINNKGKVEHLSRRSKREVARAVWNKIKELMESKGL